MSNKCRQIVLPAIVLLMAFNLMAADAYYKTPPQFHMYPDPKAPRYTLKRFGPVGIGLELRKPNFTMFITNIENN
jgi:hypothetical protein